MGLPRSATQRRSSGLAALVAVVRTRASPELLGGGVIDDRARPKVWTAEKHSIMRLSRRRFRPITLYHSETHFIHTFDSLRLTFGSAASLAAASSL